MHYSLTIRYVLHPYCFFFIVSSKAVGMYLTVPLLFRGKLKLYSISGATSAHGFVNLYIFSIVSSSLESRLCIGEGGIAWCTLPAHMLELQESLGIWIFPYNTVYVFCVHKLPIIPLRISAWQIHCIYHAYWCLPSRKQPLSSKSLSVRFKSQIEAKSLRDINNMMLIYLARIHGFGRIRDQKWQEDNLVLYVLPSLLCSSIVVCFYCF